MEIKEVLENIGFQEIESKIYLFLLKKGPVSQQTISDETGILRQTVYDFVGKMENKGFLAHSLIEKKKIYKAIEPEILLNQIKEKQEQFSQILPSLKEMIQTNNVNLFSQTFVGLKGLRNLFSLTLSSKSEICWLCNKKISDEVFYGFYWHNYSKKRIEKKIPIKLIIEPTGDKDWNTNKKAWRETKRNNFAMDLDSSFVLFEDKVLIYSIEKENLQGVLIQNKLIKQMFEKIFNLFWKQSK